ncbi:family 43 glycosylhydrolase [Paenibacillus hexagrammi]|uniref:Family 43 glycosylhydrolase n=1 Tax=Paenibacillus hexagrammi TaxID=2908839 RepID=A0ABY3SRH5_9BACL|nr:family 43 glycosylhydrolase [Paenibacillus sp. YPD9-1]UJF35766.1 family 43 glycosylhydrolase [Paenibacillus sp. YPD9-1]
MAEDGVGKRQPTKRDCFPESALYLPDDHVAANKKIDLAAEIQKADYAIQQFAGNASESALQQLNDANSQAKQVMDTIDSSEADGKDKIELLIETTNNLSVARAAFMKDMGVTSSSAFHTFSNPLYQGQDPFVTYKDGFYYFVSSSNLDSNNKVYVSKSRTLTDQGEKIMVFDSQGTQTRIFAPEIFFFDGKWYIYYCADLQEFGYKHMANVLESVTDDPQGAYVNKGALFTGENGVYKQANDFTVFDYQGQLYAVWGTLGSGEPAGPAIAPMDNPYTITANRSFLPGGGGEGPRVLQKDGKVFITVSEGDYQSNGYRLSYFMNTDGNILNPSSWTRKNDVFVATGDVSGPARAGFVKSVDGTEDWMIYHSRVYKDVGRNWWRQVNIKKFGWNEDGTPNFGQPVSPSEWQPLPSGDLGQGDMYQAENAILYGGITKDNSHTNYQGTGYVNLPNQPGAEASFVVNANEAGDYIVGARYAYGVQVDGESTNNPSNQLPARAKLHVFVNGNQVTTIAPDKTAISWNEWFTASVRLPLQAGKNVISYRVDKGDIGNVNLDYMTMYKADVPNGAPLTELTGSLTGETQVPVGSNYEVIYGLKHVSQDVSDAIYAQDLVFTFDSNKIQFVSVESLIDGLQIVDTKTDVPGQVRVLVASLGGEHAVSTDGEQLKLHWKTLQETNQAAVTLANAQFANAAGEESTTQPVTLSFAITGIPSTPGDLNSDGKVSIGDLAIAAANYGKTTASPDWDTAQQYDLNDDGKIDIADLAVIARTIIQ